ncbi:Probable dual-specificity RNA methyltransferase RlmN [Seminavis robusta]|uniref:Probable dual-specificity RNA methyltransferase RlmN n=1 Tax=Seminavis robusta TaxID=568900 RepID=A0A9N8E020_9STRA|nr:Probable dual-specificity RNA methyltransferase RlmN [Seminavis robusta]|eukprot:Sro414_g138300.1 Probable dual-specificity RNA methyltransferase RlmN (536) ;mRNA; f:40534-42331
MRQVFFIALFLMSVVERICAFGTRPRPLTAYSRHFTGSSMKASVQESRAETKKQRPATGTISMSVKKVSGGQLNLKHQEEHQPPLMNLFTISKEDLTDIMGSWGYPRYRADQVYHWIKDKGVVNVDEMHNIPKKLKQDLAKFSSSSSEQSEQEFVTGNHATSAGGALEVIREQVSPKDGTVKRLYKLRDGLLIESVLMPYDDGRWTTCISSQAGCAQGCVFCATGQNGFQRQLTSDEIVEQVTRFSTFLKSNQLEVPKGNRKRHGKQQRLSNVVFMGEGEPLANFRNVMEAVPRIQELAGIGARKITISTVGIVPNIRKLMESPIQVRLAVSLHCANDFERSALLPANRRFGGLQELMTTLYDYIETTGRRLTLEWALIEGENDTPRVARQLGDLLLQYKLRRDMVHVNVIPLNPTGGYKGTASGKKRVDEFIRILDEEFGVSCTPRVRRGIDIDAGCGQLKAKELEAEEREEELKLQSSVDKPYVSVESTTVDLDSSESTICMNEDGEISDVTFHGTEADRLISMVKGSVVKDV